MKIDCAIFLLDYSACFISISTTICPCPDTNLSIFTLLTVFAMFSGSELFINASNSACTVSTVVPAVSIASGQMSVQMVVPCAHGLSVGAARMLALILPHSPDMAAFALKLPCKRATQSRLESFRTVSFTLGLLSADLMSRFLALLSLRACVAKAEILCSPASFIFRTVCPVDSSTSLTSSPLLFVSKYVSVLVSSG